MPYCSSCGVEVDEGVERCPLCDTPIHGVGESGAKEVRNPEPDQGEKPRMSGKARRKLSWEVTSILCLIAVFVVTASDLRVHSSIGWSLYPIAAVIWAWIVSTIAIFAIRRTVLVIGGWVLATLGFLAAMNLLEGGLTWFLSLCLPIFVLCVVVSVPVIVIATRLRTVGLNVVALASLGAAVVCTGVDAVIEYSSSGSVRFSWSLIADEALLPFAGIMIFVHLRLRTRFNFRRIFHL